MTRHTSYADRLARGFLAACEASGVIGTVHPCPSSTKAIAIVDAVVADDPSITGFFVHNEGALPHVAARLAEIGRRRDADLSIVALCPEDVARPFPGSSTASPCRPRRSAPRRPT